MSLQRFPLGTLTLLLLALALPAIAADKHFLREDASEGESSNPELALIPTHDLVVSLFCNPQTSSGFLNRSLRDIYQSNNGKPIFWGSRPLESASALRDLATLSKYFTEKGALKESILREELKKNIQRTQVSLRSQHDRSPGKVVQQNALEKFTSENLFERPWLLQENKSKEGDYPPGLMRDLILETGSKALPRIRLSLFEQSYLDSNREKDPFASVPTVVVSYEDEYNPGFYFKACPQGMPQRHVPERSQFTWDEDRALPGEENYLPGTLKRSFKKRESPLISEGLPEEDEEEEEEGELISNVADVNPTLVNPYNASLNLSFNLFQKELSLEDSLSTFNSIKDEHVMNKSAAEKLILKLKEQKLNPRLMAVSEDANKTMNGEYVVLLNDYNAIAVLGPDEVVRYYSDNHGFGLYRQSLDSLVWITQRSQYQDATASSTDNADNPWSKNESVFKFSLGGGSWSY